MEAQGRARMPAAAGQAVPQSARLSQEPGAVKEGLYTDSSKEPPC